MDANFDSLVSSKFSESGLQVLLHPLALLCIAEHITRHAARDQPGPVVGFLMGYQDGRVISLIHAADCRVRKNKQAATIDENWLETRVQQYKDVYKDPPLELVGWYTVSPSSGPTQDVLRIHQQVLQKYNQNAVLLTFHPSKVVDKERQTAGKLPLTIFESVWEDERTSVTSIAAPATSQAAHVKLRFRALRYSIKSDDAEMIAIRTLAKGGNHASLNQSLNEVELPHNTDTLLGVRPVLCPEEEDMISALKARLNAIHMLESRIGLIGTYIRSISGQVHDASGGPHQKPVPSRPLLRQTFSLLSHLSLVSPEGNADTVKAKSLLQTYDTEVIELLGQLCEHVSGLRDIGKRYSLYGKERKVVTGGKPLDHGKLQPHESRSLGTIDSYGVDLAS
ncbi:hypothetical protein KEM54_000804 [Ascosphaera aggregata]|nr:hypothetical protein KEM54_000804 [Ascosphaera aggregata]